jgi:hypothetical protein
MLECLHKKVFNKIRKIVASSKYLAISYDEVTIINNQSWVSIHCYVVQNWCHLPTLIFLEQVTKGGGFDNLTKVIMDVLKKHVGVSDIDVVAKLFSFGINGVNVF